jgi:hypothetical protein
MATSMTRQHFAAIAEALRDELLRHRADDNHAAARAVVEAAGEIADTLRRFNSDFDRERFLNAVMK